MPLRTVYIDILFATNLIVDYLLLLVTAKFASRPCRRWKLLCAAALGGLFAVLVFFQPLEGWLALPFRLLVCCALCGIAYDRPPPRELFRLALVLLAVTMAFGGVVFALAYLGDGRGLLQVRGGVPYIDLPLGTLLLASCAAYGLLGLVFGAGSARKKEAPATVEVCCGAQVIRVKALRDTGNLLRDPVTTRRVLVVDKQQLWPLLTAAEQGCLRRLGPENATVVFEELGACGTHKFMLVPYRAVGQPGSLLLALKPDGITVDGKETRDYLIGISPAPIAMEDGVCAILG